MKVYFLRHAESEYNVNGWINQNPKIKVSLTQKGIKQAKKIAEDFKKINFDAIYTSQFPRTQQTGEIINKFHNLKIKIDKRLGDIKIGFEGQSDREFFKIAGKKFFNFKMDGNESWEDLKKRVADFLNWLQKKRYSKVLIITHQWVVRVANQIVNNLSNEEAFKLPVKNSDFIILDI